MCPGWSHRGVFVALGQLKLTVTGDIGCYTLGALPPMKSMDTCLCMGAAVTVAHGYSKACGKKSIAVIGDSTMVHSGITGLVSTVYNKSNVLTIILDNSTTGMTGGQHNPSTGTTLMGEEAHSLDFEMLSKAVGIKRVRTVDAYDLSATTAAIKQEIAAEGPNVLIIKRPCVLIKTVVHNQPLTVNEEKCTGCKLCLKIGCPAISVRDKKAVIDKTRCAGCGVCAELCKPSAIGKGGA
jgi:indolepyruvate ferredoxin oxidoreductase alpha subunit